MVDNPNKGGNSAGEGAPKSEWDDISDLINFGPSNKTTQPNKATVTPSSNENTGDLDGGSGKTNPNHDTSDSKVGSVDNQPVIHFDPNEIIPNPNKNDSKYVVSGNILNQVSDVLNPYSATEEEEPKWAVNINTDSSNIDSLNSFDKGNKNAFDGIPVKKQSEKNGANQDSSEKDKIDDAERIDTIGGKVHNIINHIKKSGIGKKFALGCAILALVGTVGSTVNRSGLMNNKTVNTAGQPKIEGTSEAGVGQTGSEAATNDLDAKFSAEKFDTKVDISYVDGEVMKGVDCEFGGDNTGADLLDNVNVEPGHYGPLTHKLANWVHNEGNRYREGQTSPEALTALRAEVDQSITGRLGNIAPLVQEGYVFGYFGEGDNINVKNMTQTGYEFSTNSEEYQSKKESLQRDYIEREKEMSHDIILLNKGDTYASIGAWDIKNADGTARPDFFTDNHVTAVEAGLMVRTDIDKATGLNYYDAHPEIKERVLRVMGLIEVGASEKEVQDAMAEWTVGGRLVGCMQFACFKKTPEKKIIPPVEKKIPPEKIIPPVEKKIPPEKIIPPVEKKIPPVEIIPPAEIIPPTPTPEPTPEPTPTPTPTPENKEIIPPTPTPEPTPEPTPTPTPTPKPEDKPKENEKILEPKTDHVAGANEFDTQKGATVTDQSVEATLGTETDNARVEAPGSEIENKTIEQKEVVEEYTPKDESGAENTGKSIDTVENNSNLNTGASEKQSDAEAKEVVEEVKESTEKAPDTSYDLDRASAEWDFNDIH